MFKDRLKATGKFIFENLIAPALMLTLIIVVLIFAETKIPMVVDVALWGIGIFMGILLLIGLMIFVHWLFIEPFKKGIKQSKHNYHG